MGLKRTLLFLCLWITAQPLAGQSLEYFDEILARGQQAVDAGNPETALQIWMEAVDTASPGLTDPRIGRVVIETATTDSLTDYYEQAQQAYLWGLQNSNHPGFTDELVKQVSWLEPVSEMVEHEQWQELLERQSHAELGSSIQTYWERVDPTLGTAFNEQLLKYWERIAHASVHFLEEDNSVFGTDDRGEIYVKYGSPDQINNGTLRYWGLATLIGNTYNQIVRRFRDNERDFERELARWHRDPEYEIWIYEETLPENSSNLVYLFGKEGGAFNYGIRHDVLELIPGEAPERPPVDVKFYLTLMYYWQLRGVDLYFDTRLWELYWHEERTNTDNINELLDNVEPTPRPSTRLIYAQNRVKLERIYERAPDIASFDLPLIPVELRQYRLLDEENRPRLASFLYSSPWMPMYTNPATRYVGGSEYYLTAHTVTLDSQNDILQRASGSGQSLRHTFMGNIMNMPPKVSYLSVPYDANTRRQKFTVEMSHLDLGSDRSEQLFPENLRALGSLTTEDLPPPLSTDRNRLEMGDLIIGIREPGQPAQEPFDFLVPLEPVVEAGEPLMVHVEVYHLQGSPNDPTPFQIEYRVSENRNFVQRLFTREDEVNLTFNFEAFSDSFRENLEIETSPFEPGSYTLHLTARQRQREVIRTVEFEVEE